MYSLHILILLMAVMYHVSAKTPIQNYSLTYECTKDDNIIINGNDTKLYGSIHATGTGMNGSNSTCSVEKNETSPGVMFTVSSCNLSQPVKIIVMEERQNTGDDMVLGGRNVNEYELKCNQVRRGGLDINEIINFRENDELKISKTPQKEVNMTMKIMEGKNELGSNAAVIIGQELQLIIEGNGGFAFFVRSCMATDGTSSRAHSKSLILNGTTQDPAVIGNFSNNRDQNHTELRASLYAFHFVNTNNISINCSITVCQDDDNSCPFQIHSNGKRRKRSALVQHHTNSLEKSFRVIDSYTMLVENTNDSVKPGATIGQWSFIVSMILIGFAWVLP